MSMITREAIEKLKTSKPSSIKYQMIADATDGAVSLEEVKRFFSFRTVPFEKQLLIIKATNGKIKEQEKEVRKVLQ